MYESILHQAFAFLGLAGITVTIVVAVYFAVRLISKPMAKGTSHFTLIQAKKSVARLLPQSDRHLLESVKSEKQLAQLMKSIAIKNGWNSEDISGMPCGS